MSLYTRVAYIIFGNLSGSLTEFFPDMKDNLKKAAMKTSNKEYISTCLFTSFIFFLIEVPILSFSFGIIFHGVLISLLTAITVAAVLTVLIFYLFTKYPFTIIAEKSKKIDAMLPFATLYLSTIAGTRLPLDQVFRIFAENSIYPEITKEFQQMTNDMDVLGLDVNSAMQRAVNRTPSKKLKEMLYGVLSTSTSGGDVAIYLREKSNTQMGDYRRTINEFAKKITLFIEVYLTAIVLGAIFFIILTSIFSGISGTGGNIILLQSLIIFLFIPLISVGVILLVKVSSPTGE